MNIYLVRHGDAVYQHPDDLSPLSTKGEKEIDALAKFILPLQLRARVFHSQKLRAKQTAERLAAGILLDGEIISREGLSPSDPVLPIVKELNDVVADTLLVGHMPFMGKLASQLLYQNTDREVIEFHKGTMMCLRFIGNDRWMTEWVVHPGLMQV